MDWNARRMAGFILLAVLQAATIVRGQEPPIHHNLPDNLEIIDPKTLGLSGTDLENFLGNVKLLPISGDGDTGGLGPKTQILTVGFDGNEKLNLDDFASLSTAGLADNDKTVAEMAFRKFQDFFKNPGSAQQFEEQTTPGTSSSSTSYSPSSSSNSNNSPSPSTTFNPNFNYDSTEKPKKKRVRVHKRPIFSSTYRSQGGDEGVTTESTGAYNNENRTPPYQDYARVIQELQNRTPAPETQQVTHQSNNQNQKFPVYRNFPDQHQQKYHDKQNHGSTPPQVGFSQGQAQGQNQNHNNQQTQPTHFTGPTIVTTNQPRNQQHNHQNQQHHNQNQQQQQQQQNQQQQQQFQQPEPQYFLRNNQNQPPTNFPQPHFQQQQPNFAPPAAFVVQQPPQTLKLGPPELDAFPQFQNELAPLLPTIKFDTPQNLNQIALQQQQQQHQNNQPVHLKTGHGQYFPQQQQQQQQQQHSHRQEPIPIPQAQQQHQQYVQSLPPQIVTTQRPVASAPPPPQPPQQQQQQQQQHIHHVQHITPVKANFHNSEQYRPSPSPPQYFPQEARENLVEYDGNKDREQKSFGNNNNQQQPQQQQYRLPPPAYTTTAPPASFTFPSHNRFKVNNNNYNEPPQQAPPLTTSRPFSSNGVFQVTPSTGMIPIATHENAMNYFHNQMTRIKHLESMKQLYSPGTKPSHEINNNNVGVNSFNVHTINNHQHQQHEFKHPAPAPTTNNYNNNNNFRQPDPGFSNSNQNQNQNQNYRPPPPPPQSFQHQIQFSQQSRPPPPRPDFRQNQGPPPPPPRPDFRPQGQGPPKYQNSFSQQSQEIRQLLPPPPAIHQAPPRPFSRPPGPPPPPHFNPHQQNNFIHHPVKNVNVRPAGSNYRENRVLHRITLNNNNSNNNFRQFPPSPPPIQDSFGFQVSPSTNFRHQFSPSYINNQYFRPPTILQPSNSNSNHPGPFNLLRPSQPYPEPKEQPQPTPATSAETPNSINPAPAQPLRFPILEDTNTAGSSNNNYLKSTTDHHPEAAFYAQSMGLQVHSIKPSPLLTSFRL